MIQIVSQTNSVQVGKGEYPINTLSFDLNANTGFVKIKTLSGFVVADEKFDKYTNGSDVPYASVSALQTALRSALFA